MNNATYDLIRKLRGRGKTGNEIAHVLSDKVCLILAHDLAGVMKSVGYTATITHDQKSGGDLLVVSDKPVNNRLKRPVQFSSCDRCCLRG